MAFGSRQGDTSGIRATGGVLRWIEGRSKTPIGVTVLPDREGSLWMSLAEARGVLRISKPEQPPGTIVDLSGGLIEKFTHQDGLTSDRVNATLEDREGNVWNSPSRA